MKRSIFLLVIGSLVCTLIICGHIENLPTVSEVEQGDTAYVHIYPDWEQEDYGFHTPKDIIIGDDGYLFIADSGNSRIVVLDPAGTIIEKDEFSNDFRVLNELDNPDGEMIQPLQLHQDSKMNLLICDGSNQIYAWNQYFNNKGIRYVSREVLLQNTESSAVIYTNRMDSLAYYLSNGYVLYDAVLDSSEEVISSVLAPHVIFDGNDPINYEFVDDYGDTRNSKIVDIVAAGKDYNNSIFIMDERYNRIVKLKYVIKQLVILGTGDDVSVAFDYECVFSELATGPGSGAGFIMEPLSIANDVSGNLYYTQAAGVYPCHGISSGSYRTLFNPGEDDILDLGRFTYATDIDIDSKGIIYVVDAGKNLIQTFDSKGHFLRNIATTIIDGDSSEVIEIADILNNPEAISIDENIVYVVDTGNTRIVRFQYFIMTNQNMQDSQEYPGS